MRRVDVRTSTYVRGMLDAIQSISLRWYRRREAGRAMQWRRLPINDRLRRGDAYSLADWSGRLPNLIRAAGL
jgi:hypothetical protein